MGCDYYIIKELFVKFKSSNGEKRRCSIELERLRRYFMEYDDSTSCDSDDTDYYPRLRASEERRIAEYLKVTYVPRTLFENGGWKNRETEAKYRDRIQREIGDGTLLSIVKREVRYLR
jgi:hypothetical protein